MTLDPSYFIDHRSLYDLTEDEKSIVQYVKEWLPPGSVIHGIHWANPGKVQYTLPHSEQILCNWLLY